MSEETALTLRQSETFLAPVADLDTILKAYQVKKDFIERALKKDLDFGTIPGSQKPALYKPGAEKLANIYGFAPVFEDIQTIEDWTGTEHDGEPFFYYRQKCKLYKGERLIGSADGSCNSWEKKYRYRDGQRLCPECGQPAIFKSKPPKRGYYCWSKKGGCGAQFSDNDKRITEQETGQVKNPDICDATNTILKMAQKRALVAAILITTGASDYFTQDVDDFIVDGEVIDAEFTDASPARPPTPKPQNAAPRPAASVPPEPPPDDLPPAPVEESQAVPANGKTNGRQPSSKMWDTFHALADTAASLGLVVDWPPADISAIALAERGSDLRARIAKAEASIMGQAA